ncbi:MAG: hypothetical protein F6J87_12280 [Spirulina sp. SIO3F2]|nr:hypothetical protein [Spirulina sp. SIO3F2]
MLTKAKIIELFGYGESDNFVEISSTRLQELGLLDEVQTLLPDLCFPYNFRHFCFTMDFTPLSEDYLFKSFPGLAREQGIYVIGHLPFNPLHGLPLGIAREFNDIHWFDGGFPSNASLYELGNHAMDLLGGELDFSVRDWDDLSNAELNQLNEDEQKRMRVIFTQAAKEEILDASRILIDLNGQGQIIMLDAGFRGLKNLRTFQFFNSSLRQLVDSLIACQHFLDQDHEEYTLIDMSPLKSELERIDPRCVGDETTVWTRIIDWIQDDIFGF